MEWNAPTRIELSLIDRDEEDVKVEEIREEDSSPVTRALNLLLRKKKINLKDGAREEYVIHENQMEEM